MTERERQKLDPHFVSFLFARCFSKQTLPKTNRSFHCVSFLCRVLLRDAVRCGARSAEQSERSLILSRQ